MKKIYVLLAFFSLCLVILSVIAWRNSIGIGIMLIGIMFDKTFYIACIISFIGLTLSFGEYLLTRDRSSEVATIKGAVYSLFTTIYCFYICGFIISCFVFSALGILPEDPFDGRLLLLSLVVSIIWQTIVSFIKYFWSFVSLYRKLKSNS